MTKHLVSLHSVGGKTPEQVAREIIAAHKKYHKIYNQELAKLTKKEKHKLAATHPLGIGAICSCGKFFGSDAAAKNHLQTRGGTYNG